MQKSTISTTLNMAITGSSQLRMEQIGRSAPHVPHPHPEIQQSPIDLRDSLSTRNSSYLFVNFYEHQGLIFWYNTTVYIRSSLITKSFGEVYTQTVKGVIPALRASEIRIRTQSEHTVNGEQYPL